MSSFEVRNLRIEAAPGCAELITALGYPTTPEQMRGRVDRLISPERGAFVAEDAFHALLGLAGGSITDVWESDRPFGRLNILVVSERARGAGVGGALVAAVEEWARARGAENIVVTSGSQRHAAHRFYESHGFQATGVRLVKRLMA